MSDRELLELAAKAAGIEVTAVVSEGIPHRFGGGYWNPLTDDGDCARLEVACELKIDIGDAGVIAERVDGIYELVMYEDTEFDRNAARRLASTRAAAEIGRSMP